MTGRKVATAAALSIGASAGLMVTYIRGGQPQWEGALLGIAFAGIGWAIVVMAHDLWAEVGTEDHGPLSSPETWRQEVADGMTRPVTRRGLLFGMLAAAVGALAVALGFPIRSLGPSVGRKLHETAWTDGIRLVDETGEPIGSDSLEYGSTRTAFPEGFERAADSVVVLVRVHPARLTLDSRQLAGAPEGHVAYSKICTHAGCPVGLFDSDTGQLICPCHQSSFDALAGAVPAFGPADRPLPQLPLAIRDGYLVAAGEMTDAVGPGFWSLPRDQS